MTEHDARQWIDERFGSAAVDQLDTFASMVVDESHRQNLIAPSTIPAIWTRHLLDSAQLVPLAPPAGLWVDIGTGAGFPGLVAAILRPEATILVEPRRQRAIFLERCVAALRLERVEVRSVKVEQLVAAAAVISARAVGPVEKLLQGGAGCATNNTRWLLPRGRLVDELAALQARWTGLFHMKQSITDPQSMILICEGPNRR